MLSGSRWVLKMARSVGNDLYHNRENYHGLSHLLSLYGLPDQLVSDNGPQFASHEFAAFMKSKGIQLHITEPQMD